MTTYGGRREGAGRKATTTDGGTLMRKTVTLDVTTIKVLTRLGDGVLHASAKTRENTTIPL